MIQTSLFCVLALTIRIHLVVAVSQNVSSQSSVFRTLGGNPAPLRKFAFQVSLRKLKRNEDRLGYSFCSGTILSARWIVTAGHCFRNIKFNEDLYVVAGDVQNDRRRRNGQQIVKAERWFAHEDFDIVTKQNDIGLIFLSDALEMTEVVSKISLPERYAEYKGRVVASGWGVTERNQTSVILLYTDKLRIMETVECRRDVNRKDVTDTQICVGPNSPGGIVDTCEGDSGGPLTKKDENETTFIVGIVSYGDSCYNERPSGSPVVYTKVSYFVDWILKSIIQHYGLNGV